MRIQVENLHYSYPSGVEALAGVTFTVEAGERLAIVGQNGAGKTTLVKHLNGLLLPTSGTVSIGDWRTDGHSVAQLAARVGYVFQNPDEQLFKGNVRDEVVFGPSNLRFAPERVDTLVHDALALMQLEDKATTNPYDLTPTWRKRVAMAAVVAMDTPVIVLDEPTTGQDDQSIRHLADVIAFLQTHGKTVIAISHDIDFVADQFDRIIVMGQGKVLLDGTAATVFGQATVLNSTYVEPPQLTRLGQRLALGPVVYTVDTFLDALAAQRVRIIKPS